MTTTNTTEPILSPETAIAALSSDDNQIRYYAAWWLGKHQIQAGCMALCDALFDERYRIPGGGYPLRRQAARALGQLKNPQAVPALVTALECDEDLRFTEAAIAALAAIGDKKAINPLLNLLQSTQEQPYEALIEALATLQVWSAQPQIEAFLKHPSERVQCAAARYMYLLTQQPQYIERIVKNLNHDNMYLRWAAVFDLGAVGHQQAIQAILTAQVPNSLKLLNLKRILETLLESHNYEEKTALLIFQAIDDLLIQL
ncbi:PBS lyase HEAT-like repeat protein [Anabaenopsis circularis NIES-21]|uniref:PBS lyase HEAT-like repeat protein n=2 Tax=Nostocales TaxID=1161 RepID=A0A1Z4GAV6_9CYAN|nr:HEAT repeat domain-containing protein [Nostoc cycadae]BAY14663.1 PBS lyase HEAT-like repeat protein [Anabaenopsis circularis NIES-21]GBE92339.1 PBS lyase HEAT domain-containing protein repeat-containing protein [Nostoc cycadae WK-1]